MGDLAGERQWLADHGVQIDFTLVQTFQSVAAGGNTAAWSRAVTQSAIRTLTGALIEPVSQRLEVITSREAQQRIALLSSAARAEFAKLLPGVQQQIRDQIATVSTDAWNRILPQVDRAIVSNTTKIESELAKIVRGQVAGLTIGNFDNNDLSTGGIRDRGRGS